MKLGDRVRIVLPEPMPSSFSAPYFARHAGKIGRIEGIGLRAGRGDGTYTDMPDGLLVSLEGEVNPFSVTGYFPFPPEGVVVDSGEEPAAPAAPAAPPKAPWPQE